MEWINYFGLAMVFGAILGVVIHAASGVAVEKRKKEIENYETILKRWSVNG